MKIGDLVYYKNIPKEWGFIIQEHHRQYLIYWHDGGTAWISKHNVVLLEAL